MVLWKLLWFDIEWHCKYDYGLIYHGIMNIIMRSIIWNNKLYFKDKGSEVQKHKYIELAGQLFDQIVPPGELTFVLG